jgi:hypothetical protein
MLQHIPLIATIQCNNAIICHLKSIIKKKPQPREMFLSSMKCINIQIGVPFLHYAVWPFYNCPGRTLWRCSSLPTPTHYSQNETGHTCTHMAHFQARMGICESRNHCHLFTYLLNSEQQRREPEFN